MRELAKAGVPIGFCGGGTSLFSANEIDVEVAWLTPQSGFRSTIALRNRQRLSTPSRQSLRFFKSDRLLGKQGEGLTGKHRRQRKRQADASK